MTVNDFTPTGNYILIDPAVEKTTSSGIILQAETSKELPSTGKILKTSPGASHIPVGSIVFFNKFSGAIIKIEDVEYHVLKMEDIYGYGVS